MADPYASLEDLKMHWPDLPSDRETEAAQKLLEASIEVRALYPDLDQRVIAGTMDAAIPRLVVCRMVKRAMDVTEDAAPPQGFESFQFGAGPYSMGGKLNNPDGDLYLSKKDRNLLGSGRERAKACTIHPGGRRV